MHKTDKQTAEESPKSPLNPEDFPLENSPEKRLQQFYQKLEDLIN